MAYGAAELLGWMVNDKAIEPHVPVWDKTQRKDETLSSEAFSRLLKQHGIAISMDGRGCWRDNVFVERLWRTVK